jgi:DNA-binding HxlR family transcriptional regulator
MVKAVLPGRPARGSKSGRPIMALLDLLGRRWTLRIVWELRGQPRRFRELQDLIGASPTIINTRLAELREAKLVRLDDKAGYRLTALGEELLRLFLPLHLWSEKWAKAVSRP